MDQSYDLIVVGSGIAGLYAALLTAPHRRVLLVTKGALEESNTRYAQGGIAVALAPGDSPELHLRDTIAAGDGLCDARQVAILTEDAPGCILDLLQRGVPFDRERGELAWTREAAHTVSRVLHSGGDATGASVERTLALAVRAAGVTVQEHALCTALLQSGGRVKGVTLLREDGTISEVQAGNVLLATGGAGQLFARTTNPAVATGDGMAIAFRAGAELADVEFMQFHPTALVLPGAPSFLISEAVRGEGGVLRDRSGRAFMADYHPDCELAPRDVVARSIHAQMQRTGEPHAWLDMTHLAEEHINRRFPSIVRFCRGIGIDPVRQSIPVAPAAHYWMGGIRTDSWGRTTLPGLMACGEVACTGVHGANRLASNSLLEGLVFAQRAAQCLLSMDSGENNLSRSGSWLPSWSFEERTIGASAPEQIRTALATTMWKHVGVVRSAESLYAARETIAQMADAMIPTPSSHEPRFSQRAAYEAVNLMLLGRLLVEAALVREESRGAHFRTDFPQREPSWQGHVVLSRDGCWRAPLEHPTQRLSPVKNG